MTTLVDTVVDKAVSDVWQRPSKDRGASFHMKPITTGSGALRFVNAWNINFPLPDGSNRYQVYNLGQLNPNLFGFDTFIINWTSLEEICNREDMQIQLLINNRALPLKHAYIKRTEHRNTIIAIDSSKCYGLLDDAADVVIHFYSNYWFGTPTGNLTTGMTVSCYDLEDTATLTAFWNELTAARARTSNQIVYKNGFFIDPIDTGCFELGDYVEIIEDMSGVGYYDIKLSSAPFFLSTMDKKGKYLLLAPDDATNEVFRYVDDINIFIYNKDTSYVNGEYPIGVTYDLYADSDIRMVTHRDHSIDSVRVKDILLMQDDLYLANAYVRVYTRNADDAAPLPDDGQYIKDMYLFSREERKKFMVGTLALIDEWKASNLEASAYTKWMNLRREQLEYSLVKDVYSYHGLYGMIELPWKDGAVQHLPPIAYKGGTVLMYNADYEYDRKMTISAAMGASGVFPLPAGIQYIEFIPGEQVSSGFELEGSVGNIDPQGDFAEEYFIRLANGSWVKAVEGEHYELNTTNRTIDFFPQFASNFKTKRLSGKFQLKEASILREDLYGEIPIFDNGLPVLDTVPTGRVDVWLNGKKLIRGLDYKVEWPNVSIHNVEWALDANEVMILAHGLPSDTDSEEFGVIEYRHVNYDERFRLDFNRPVNITIDGRLGVKEKVSFSEKRLSSFDPLYREGAPYKISKPVNHIPIVYNRELAKLREEGQAIDKKLEDYLSTLDKEDIIPVVNVISNKHEVMSYTLCRLIEDLNSGRIEIINDTLSDAGVGSIMLNYTGILSGDPTTNKDWRWEYILLAPHNQSNSVGVSALHYSFLERVNALFFDGRCQLNNYLHVV